MHTCDECTDRLLDFLYGLLEADEVQPLRDHLAACPACKAALADAEAQQRLLARAAHVAQVVPAFVAPSDQPLQETPATLPLPVPPTRTRRQWPWLAAAAALLLVAGGLYWSYERGLDHRQAD